MTKENWVPLTKEAREKLRWKKQHLGQGRGESYCKAVYDKKREAKLAIRRLKLLRRDLKDVELEPYVCRWTNYFEDGEIGSRHYHIGRTKEQKEKEERKSNDNNH